MLTCQFWKIDLCEVILAHGQDRVTVHHPHPHPRTVWDQVFLLPRPPATIKVDAIKNVGMDYLVWIIYCAVICDIDRAVAKYTFFGNGGDNLHAIFF